MKQYDLNPMDPFLASKDSDGDQFTNAEEFQNDTNPVDARSYPPRITKLRLVSLTNSDLGLILRGRVDDKNYQIDLVANKKTETELVEIGEAFGPQKQFRLESFEEKRTSDAQGIPVDQSEAIVSHHDVGNLARNPVRLQHEVLWEKPSHEGLFENTFDGERKTVKRGGSLKLSNDTGRRYVLQSVTAAGATFHDENGIAFEVPFGSN